MQLQPVEPAFRAPARGAHELGGYPIHVARVIATRQLIARPYTIGDGAMTASCPRECSSLSSQPSCVEPFGPALPELQGDPGGRSIMHVADDPLPRAAMLRRDRDRRIRD